MQQSEDANTPKQLSREQRWEIVQTLLQRSNLSNEAKQVFRQAYPYAPEEMLKTAVFHTYVDGIGAAIDWLVDLELFLREPSHELDIVLRITCSITSTIGISSMHCFQMGKQEC
ncbi:MAG: hypothetical protein HWQ41_01785 [Nostoc sp. NOS(2021)]|uniref:hypothetical protein n=1 Tax=Nostoc sp. NOS(2021) TaxID=2815407 RepID=UPI0025FAD76A|nr:hypothetical protein [Nostoc sp. NOS(2021)]MBN3894061.1 hypothetical protein [Nostoc sp. NOS(2021)]